MRRFGITLIVCAAFGLGSPAVANPRADLQSALDRFVAANPAAPGVVATVRSPGRGIDWSGAAGLADRGAKTPLTPTHAFRIASVTKLFVAATALRLAEDGRIDLASPIAAYVDPASTTQLRAGGYDPGKILVRQLLTHTSGIADYAQNPLYAGALLGNPAHKWTRREQIQFAMDKAKPVGAPGQRFGYSDTGYILLGEIIERATGKPLSAAVRQTLGFDRLRLADSFWEDGKDRPARARPMAKSYLGDIDTSALDASFDLFGGGGIVSTTQDLTSFVRAAATGHVFARPGTTVAALAVPAAERDASEAPYAQMGTWLTIGGEQCWGHTGFFGTFAFNCPMSDTTYAVQYGLGGVPVRIADLLEALSRAASGRPAAR